jgi:hypothetical protein
VNLKQNTLTYVKTHNKHLLIAQKMVQEKPMNVPLEINKLHHWVQAEKHQQERKHYCSETGKLVMFNS